MVAEQITLLANQTKTATDNISQILEQLHAETENEKGSWDDTIIILKQGGWMT